MHSLLLIFSPLSQIKHVILYFFFFFTFLFTFPWKTPRPSPDQKHMIITITVLAMSDVQNKTLKIKHRMKWAVPGNIYIAWLHSPFCQTLDKPLSMQTFCWMLLWLNKHLSDVCYFHKHLTNFCCLWKYDKQLANVCCAKTSEKCLSKLFGQC